MKQLFQPRLSQLGAAIAWLTDIGVSANRLAGSFGTTPAHIRVLAYRARHLPTEQLSSTIIHSDLDDEIYGRVHKPFQIRPHLDEVILTRKKQTALDWLEHEIQSRFLTYSRQYRFLDGA